MGKYIVELTDRNGVTGCIQITLPWRKVGTNKTNSTWRVLDESFLKVRSGTCQVELLIENNLGVMIPPLDLKLVAKGFWGVNLYSFTDRWTLVEESGTGEILQAWVGHCKPGAIKWSLLA